MKGLKVFLGVGKRRDVHSISVANWPYALASYSHFYKRAIRPSVALLMRRSFKETFLDSGAFGIISRSKASELMSERFRQAYRRFISQFGFCFDWVTSPDFPCEPTAHFGLSVPDRVRLTVEESVSHLDFLNQLGIRDKAVSVIQGFDPEDYLTCIDQHRQAGSLTSLMGVGSLCIEKTRGRVMRVLRAVREALPDWVKVHAFGLSIKFLLEARPLIDSTDSHAWSTGLEVWGKVKGKMPRQRRVPIPRWKWGEAEREEAVWYIEKLRKLLAQGVLA